MDSIVNSFALLGDEDGDDMAVLAEHLISKKTAAVAATVVAAPALDQPTQGNVASFDNGRGGRGREGYGRYRHENNGYGNTNRGYGYGGNQYRGQRGYYNDRHQVSGGNRNTTEAVSDGWVQIRTSPVRGGYGNEVYYNNRDDGRRYGNYGGGGGDQRRGYGGFRGSQDGMSYSRSEHSNNGHVVEDVNVDADVNAVVVEPTKAVSEGDAAPVTEQPTPEASVKGDEEVAKLPREGKVDRRARKEQDALKKKQDARKEAERKYREEYNKWRSLEEYEALLAEKRKVLETQKSQERKVTLDKDFEAMTLKPNKKKPEAPKLKKKVSLDKDDKKTVSISEFLKPEAGRVGNFRNGGRPDTGFRNGGRPETGRVGESRNGGRADTGFRNGGNRAEPAVIKNKDLLTGEGGITMAKEAPKIHIEDQVEFPVLKGAARAV